LFLDDPVETWAFGGGIKLDLTSTISAKFDYVYQDFGVFSNIQSFTLGLIF